LSEADTEQQGLSITYAAGPLSIGAGMNERNHSFEGTASAVGAKVNAELDWIGASYNFGVATVSAAQIKRKDSSTAAAGGAVTVNSDIKTNVFGVSVPMGAITLNASVYNGNNKHTAVGTDDTKLSGHQISARYAFSKRTTAYALMGENKIARDGANTAGAARKATGTMVGLLHSF
jgi:predicted porin